MANTSSIRAFDFINGIGVDTHLPYTDGGYANANTIINDLSYLGINHVRDGVMDDRPYPGDEGQLSYGALAAAGVKFMLNVPSGSDIAHSLGLVTSLVQRYPGSVIGIEGPNEVNNWPVTYNGSTGAQAAINFQNAIFSAVKASSTLSALPVLNMTSWPDLVGASDDSNLHVYPSGGDQPLTTLMSGIAQEQSVMPGRPVAVTESGYFTLPAAGGVDLLTQAKLTLNLLMDSAKAGVQGVYLYQLLDAYADPQGSDPEKHYGLFDASNAPKPAATAIHNLTTILSDQSTGPANLAGPATFNVTGASATDANLVIQKSSGATDLVFWSEPDVWNETSHQPVAASAHSINVALDKVYATVTVYDPLVSSAPIATLQNVGSVQLSLTDHPLIIEVPASAGAVSSPPASVTASTAQSGTLSLKVSGDQFGADLPSFQAFIDGKAVGGTQAVSALHSNGQWQTIAVGSGIDPNTSHQIQIQFLNDASDATHDRNLYVGQVSLNGVTVAGSSAVSNSAALSYQSWDPTAAVMVVNGVASFTLPATNAVAATTVSTSTSSSLAITSGAVTLKVSGDQFGPDLPSFQVLVDGKPFGGPQSVAAVHSAGEWNTVTVGGALDPTIAHQIQVQFLNDAFDGTHDRNLYVQQVAVNGMTVAGSAAVSNSAALGFERWDPTAAVMAGDGVASFIVAASASAAAVNPVSNAVATTPTLSSATPGTATPNGTITLKVAGDQYGAELPKFKLFVDGAAVGDERSVTAMHSAGQWDTVTVNGTFDPTTAHQVQVQFLNDAYDGVHDRNLYVGQVTLNGVAEAGSQAVSNSAALGFDGWDRTAAVMAGNGTASFSFGATSASATPTAASANSVVVTAAGDQFGDQLPAFQLYVDNAPVGSVQAVSALHGSGQWQSIQIDSAVSLQGAHQVEVRFINDDWDGVHDRNLYVKSVTISGHAYGAGDVASNTAALGFGGWDPNAAVLAGNGGVVYDVFGY